MRYSDPMKLADLPPEHWARIPPEAYARLLAEDPIEWIKRGGDGTFVRPIGVHNPQQTKLRVLYSEFF